ncbi:MAG: BACON domain-containing protein, partial [Bacteroidales bacterium]|nr:BACON domain-containing protein [Bacteroidales bacterium]
MRKVFYLFAALIACALTMNSCVPKPDPTPVDENAVELTQVVAGVSDFFNTWDETREMPTSFTVGGKSYTLAQFVMLEAGALTNIAGGKTDKVSPKEYSAPSNPERDSYDKEEIAVTNGPADGKGNPEDLATLAAALIKAAGDKNQIPNQTIVYRGSEALAFSTNRFVITAARALAAYAADGKLPAKVSTDYLGGSAGLKAFAQEFVKYLDVWEANVCDRLSADGSACEDNNNPLERVHFIPIPNDSPSDTWTKQGLQYDPKYQPYVTVEVDGTTYTAAQCWEIAIRGLMNMCTTTGEAFLNDHSRNGNIPVGNGKSFSSAPISRPSEACIWGMYPWYEYVNQGQLLTYNGKKIEKIGLEPIMKCTSWHVVRSFISNANNSPLGKIGNFQEFGTGSGTLNLEGYEGLISPMREFLVLCRIYKYLLDNNINSNVYDALKDQTFDFDLYKQELPIVMKTKEVGFEADPEGAKTLEFTATENWTASTNASWVHLDKTSGGAGEITISVTADKNTATENRSDVITLAAGTYSKNVDVKQAAYVAPTSATILDFVKEYVKILDVWKNTTGTVNMYTDVPVENAHYVPSTTTINVGGKTYNTADMWETALRCYLLVRGYNGLETEKYGKNSIDPLPGGAQAMSTTTVPPTHAYEFGSWPFNETTGNGGHLVMGNDENGEHCKVKVDILDNWAMRSLNFQHGQTITNLCGYSGGQLPGYYGCFCSQRALITYAFFFKYMLDNNLDKGTDVPADAIIRSELFGDEGGSPSVTIKDFAQEYVKILDVWQKTTGTVNMYEGVPVENAHYVPETTTITVGGKVYNTADMWETALRCYLLVRGYDGLETEKYGKNSIPALAGGAQAMSSTEVPETHGYYFGSWPFNETSGNGGHLVMGNDENGEHCKVKVDILDNWAMRSLNYQHGQTITNLCGYSGGQLPGYYGCFCSQRALITYAFFFKYMLDNNLEKGTDVSADAIIRSELFGDEGGAPAANSLKAFATEFVKVLDVWASHTGNIDADGKHNGETGFKNVHYIPVKSIGYPDSDNNKGDEWTITFNGETLNLAQCYIIAAKGFLYLTTTEKGTLDHTKFKENELNTYTLGNGGSLNDAAEDPAAVKALS